MTKKKILYLFSDTGGGHRSAATALMKAVDHLGKGKCEQEMTDVFASTSNFLNMFARLYGPVIKYSPKLWGQLYFWLDDPKKLEFLERIAKPFIMTELIRLIREKDPAVIVSVHPMVNHLTVRAIKQLGRRVPFVVVITDPVTVHRAWVAPGVDQVVVATEEARKLAVKYGTPPKRVKVVGMPIDPKFFLEQKPVARSKQYTILLMGGGEGAGKMGEIIEELKKQNVKCKIIVICGRNKKLETQLKKDRQSYPFPLQVYGFTDKVRELMAASDVIVTKAGPGTIAEALAMNLPIIITDWLPGQEEGNVEYVIKTGVGRVNKDPRQVVEILREFQDETVLKEIRINIKRASRPQAAMEIAREILRFL